MFNEEYIINIKKLYENIFKNKANNSEEFINFVQGNPHSLRILVDKELTTTNDKLLEVIKNISGLETNSAIILTGKKAKKLLRKRDLLKELERIIMEYIENYVK